MKEVSRCDSAEFEGDRMRTGAPPEAEKSKEAGSLLEPSEQSGESLPEMPWLLLKVEDKPQL